MTGKYPYVTLICPVYNDEIGIKKTLTSLTEQAYPNERYEIMVVDNDSTDSTQEAIASFCQRHPDLVHLLVEDKTQSSYAARNLGIQHAKGDYLLFIDADMTVEADWIESVIRSMRSRSSHYMGCRVKLYTPTHETTLAAKFDCAFGFPVKSYLRNRHFVPTCCLSTTKALIEHIGMFDDDLTSGGDYEFGIRTHESEFEQAYDDSIVVYHPARSSLWSLINKRIRTAKGLEDLLEKYPERIPNRSLLDPRNFLPPWPQSVLKRIQKRQKYSTIEIFIFYLIQYILKLVAACTRLKHRCQPNTLNS